LAAEFFETVESGKVPLPDCLNDLPVNQINMPSRFRPRPSRHRLDILITILDQTTKFLTSHQSS
jgi:hypothetical protein